MNNLIINGTQEFMGMEIPVIEGGFGEGQKVVLAKTVAEIHEYENGEKSINKLINNNITRFNNDDLINLCSENFKVPARNLGFITSNAQKQCYLLSQRGYTKLVAMMDNSNDKKWEVMNDLIDEYFTLRAKEKSGQANNFENQEDIIIYQMKQQKKMKEKLKAQDTKINETKQELTRMKDCMLCDIDNKNWREETNTLLFKTACRMARVDDELDRDDYLSKLHNLAWDKLKERTRCNLNARLKHMKERMLANGATKTQINKLRFLDVIEQDNNLLYAYIAIVKEISIKH
ncbi:ORF6N domain-containing protein [Clostridium thermobutyricum]|uniref:ORF6N domain-containing protein n=1 Tax=Clostridium thermobutyricum TaxID=29372 RepID=UPI0018ABC4F4|nr:ORF6N domain-containing protein [Clostridium thermobutyricum]